MIRRYVLDELIARREPAAPAVTQETLAPLNPEEGATLLGLLQKLHQAGLHTRPRGRRHG